MPSVPVEAEAGLFRKLTRGLLREPPKPTEDVAAADLGESMTSRPRQSVVRWDENPPFVELPSHTLLRRKLSDGADTSHLTHVILKETGPEGDRALDILQRNGIQVIYRKGGGYVYDHSTKTIYADLNLGGLGGQIIHETTHAEYSIGDLRVATSGGDFVNYKLAEETDATTRQAKGNLYVQRANPLYGLPDSPLQRQFMDGGAAAVLEAFRNGDVVPSILTDIVPGTGLRVTYPEALAEVWKNRH